MTNKNNQRLQNKQGKTIQVPNQKKVSQDTRVYKQGSFAFPEIGNLIAQYSIDTEKYKGLQYSVTLPTIENFTPINARATCGCTAPIIAEDKKSLTVTTNLNRNVGSKSITITIWYKEDKEGSNNQVARKAQITFKHKAE